MIVPKYTLVGGDTMVVGGVVWDVDAVLVVTCSLATVVIVGGDDARLSHKM
jgi:hypothetical protein